MKSRKAQSAAIIGFLLFGIVFVMGLYILAVPMSHVWDQASEQLKDESAFGSDNLTVQKIEQIDSFITPAYDQLVFIAFAGILLTLLIISIFFTDNPVFLIFLIIGFIIIVIIASQFVNVADTAVRDPSLDDKVDDYTLSPLIFGSALPIILIVVSLTSVIIILARSRGGITA